MIVRSIRISRVNRLYRLTPPHHAHLQREAAPIRVAVIEPLTDVTIGRCMHPGNDAWDAILKATQWRCCCCPGVAWMDERGGGGVRVCGCMMHLLDWELLGRIGYERSLDVEGPQRQG